MDSSGANFASGQDFDCLRAPPAVEGGSQSVHRLPPNQDQRTALPMKRLAYFMILLLMCAQVDDAWAVAPASPSAPLTDDNDEYLPSQWRSLGEQFSSPQKRLFDGRKPRTTNFSSVRRGVPTEWNLT